MTRYLSLKEFIRYSVSQIKLPFEYKVKSALKKIGIFILTFIFLASSSVTLYAQCCANGPNLLENYNPGFQEPIPPNGVPPGFQSDNTFVPSQIQAGAGRYLIIPSRNWGACATTPQYDHTFGNNIGKYLWFDTPPTASSTNPAVVWKPYDPNKPAGTQNLINVTANTDYVFGVWIRDLARATNCAPGGGPVMGLRINGIDMAEVDLNTITIPCCPEWVYLCTPWNSGNNTSALILIESRSARGYTDLGIDDVYFGSSTSPDASDFLGKDTTMCPGDNIELVSPFPNALNIWNGTDTGAILKVDTPGTYWLYINDTVNNSKCEGSDTIIIKRGLAPAFSLGNDTSFCNGGNIDIYPHPIPDDSVGYKWFNNNKGNFVNVRSSGIIWLDMSNGCGTTRDSVIVTIEAEPKVSLPDDIEFCLSDSIDISVVALPEENLYTYKWTPSSYLRDDTSRQNKFFAPAGDYQIHASASTASGCMGYDSMLISILEPNLISIQPKDTTIYYGDFLQLRTSGSNTISGNSLYSWWPTSSLDDPNSASPVASPKETTLYTVLAINDAGCRDSGTVNVNVIYRSDVLIPNAFSPNGDGINDEFRIHNLKYEKLLSFRVFNRWGQLLFETSDPGKGWNGMYKNKKAESGTYYYYISLNNPNGRNKIFKGDITLIR